MVRVRRVVGSRVGWVVVGGSHWNGGGSGGHSGVVGGDHSRGGHWNGGGVMVVHHWLSLHLVRVAVGRVVARTDLLSLDLLLVNQSAAIY